MKYILITLLVFAICVVNAQTKKSAKSFGKVLVDNEQMTVYEFESGPGKDVCGLGKHSHPPHLTILLNDATFTITTADGKVTTQKVKAGTTFWSEAETHMVINSGSVLQKTQMVVPKTVKKK